jgi:uncharacterized membrane protein YbhN (UPF0104 family)
MSDFLQNWHFKKYLYITLGIIFIYYTLGVVDLDKNKITNILKDLNYFNLFIAVTLYLLSHTVRVLRLVILNPLANYSIRNLWREQYKANGVNILLPFKLGEAYRLIYFRSFFGSYFNSFVTLICERFLDLLIIFTILSISIYLSPLELSALNYVLFGSLILLLIMALIYYSIEELTLIIHKIFVEKKTTRLNSLTVKSTGNFLNAIKKIKKILNQKYTSCLAISFLIWTLEISAFFIFFEILDGKIDLIIFLALAVSLSSLLPNGPMGLGGIQLAFYSIGIVANNPDIVNYSVVYSLFIFGSGLLISGALFIHDYFIKNKDA